MISTPRSSPRSSRYFSMRCRAHRGRIGRRRGRDRRLRVRARPLLRTRCSGSLAHRDGRRAARSRPFARQYPRDHDSQPRADVLRAQPPGWLRLGRGAQTPRVLISPRALAVVERDLSKEAGWPAPVPQSPLWHPIRGRAFGHQPHATSSRWFQSSWQWWMFWARWLAFAINGDTAAVWLPGPSSP